MFRTMIFFGICWTVCAEPKFAAPVQNVTVTAGREAKLACAVDDLQQYKVAWVHYNARGSAVLTVGTHVLTTNSRVSVIAERDLWTLVIANVTVADQGKFMCQISTVPPKKTFGRLTVRVPPSITKPPGDITVSEGSKVVLECHATGDPKPNITWTRESDKTTRNHRSYHGERLVLKTVKKTDVGAFLCVASNGVAPAVSARAQIFVKYAPNLLNSTSDSSVLIGVNFILSCTFEAYPRSPVTWTLSGKPIRRGIDQLSVYETASIINSRLHLTPLKKSDFGKYKCQMTNAYGTNFAFISIDELFTTTPPTTSTSTTTTLPVSSTSTVSTKPTTSHPKPTRAATSTTMPRDMQIENKIKSTLHYMPYNSTSINNSEEEKRLSKLNRFVQDSPLSKPHLYDSGEFHSL